MPAGFTTLGVKTEKGMAPDLRYPAEFDASWITLLSSEF
jgi:hypothetical protein